MVRARRWVPVLFSLFFFSRIHGFEEVISFNEGDLNISEVSGSLEVQLRGGYTLIEPGMPKLPFSSKTFLLPEGTGIREVEALTLEVETLSVGVNLRRVPKEWAKGGSTEPEIKEDIPRPYPRKVLLSYASGGLLGYPVGEISLAPIRYDYVDRVLILVKKIRLKFKLRSSTSLLSPLRGTLHTERFREDFLRRFLSDSLGIEVEKDGGSVSSSVFMPTEFPSLTGSPVSMVIITTDTLEEAFRPLADWRTSSGIPTVVKTTSWISENYPGADLAERIRNFLKDAYVFWGIEWLILGGDPDVVPKKSLYDGVPGLDSFYYFIPSDRYYADLECDWDRNGNGLLGEFSDSIDLFPDLFVGRIPVRTQEEVENFLGKLNIYEKNPGSGSYLRRAFFMGSSIWTEGDGGQLCESIVPYFPDSFETGKMYETDTYDPTVSEFMDSISSGYGIVYTQSHGAFELIAISYIGASHIFYNNHAMDLQNYSTPAFFYIGTCDAGGDDRECLEEHIFRSEGGAFAAFSFSRVNYPYFQINFDKVFFDSLFNGEDQTLGALVVTAQIPFIPLANSNPYYRYQIYAHNLEADPVTRLWVWQPRSLLLQVEDSIPLGLDTVTVIAMDTSFTPLQGVSVTLWKEDEALATGVTDLQGVAKIPVIIESPGSLSVVAQGDLYLPNQVWIPIFSDGGYPSITTYRIDEIDGDRDGTPEPGETFELTISVENTGEGTISEGWAKLNSLDPRAHVLVERSDFSAIPEGETSDLGPFTVSLSEDIGDRESFFFTLSFFRSVPTTPISRLETHPLLEENPPPFEKKQPESIYPPDTLTLFVRAPLLLRVGHSLSGGDTLYLRLELVNRGGGDALQISAELSSYGVQFIDSIVFLGDLGPGDFLPDTLSPPFIFLGPGDPLDSVDFLLTIDYHLGYQSETLRLRSVQPPEELRTEPLWDGTRVLWSPSEDPCRYAYRVYRSDSQGGEMELLTPLPIRSLLLEDKTVVPGSFRDYWVSAVDSFGNESEIVGPIRGYANPPQLEGWPVWVPELAFSSPLTLDLIPELPGLEVVACSREGVIYAFSSSGEILPGWPIDLGDENGFFGSPAAADLDLDGYLEVVAAPRGAINQVFAFEGDGSYVEGWPRSISGGSGQGNSGVFGSPVIADLDTNGAPEVIVKTIQGKVYVWHGDGEGFLDSTGLIFDLNEESWGESHPSVGDVDYDGIPDIVLGTREGALYVISPEGVLKEGFPVEGLGSIMGSIALGDIEPDSQGLETTLVGGTSLYVIDASGDILPGWPKYGVGCSLPLYNHPSLADLDGDGYPEVILNGEDGIYAYDKSGSPAQGFPFVFEGGGASSVVVGRLSDELLLFRGTSEGWTRGFDISGAELGGFPIFLVEPQDVTPTIADIDSDGSAELLLGSGADRIWVFELGFTVDAIEWQMFKHDIGRTGDYESNSVLMSSMEKKDIFSFGVRGPFPNPLLSRGVLLLTLPKKTKVEISLFDCSGRMVGRILEDKMLKRGLHRIYFDTRSLRGDFLPSGVYFLMVKAGLQRSVRSLLNLR